MTSTCSYHDILANCIVYAAGRAEMASPIVGRSDNVLMDGLMLYGEPYPFC
jgi:hypothetical protein